MLIAASICCLILVFALATALPVNMGVLAFVAAFALAAASGLSSDDVFESFPGDTFILIAGITLLFGVAGVNGTMRLCIDAALRPIGGRRWAVPWMIFLIGGLVMSFGFVLAVGVLAPMAMSLAHRYRIRPLLMAMMVSHGALAACLSPVTVYSAFTRQAAVQAGIPLSSWQMFLAAFVLNLLFATALFAILGRDLWSRPEPDAGGAPAGHDAVPGAAASGTHAAKATPVGPQPGGGVLTDAPAPPRTEPDTQPDTEPDTETRLRLTPIRLLTILAVLGLVAGASLGADIGVVALAASAVLLLLAPVAHAKAFDQIGWSAIMLVCGMLTLMAVLSANGTVAFIADSAAALGNPQLAVLLILVMVGLLSAVGSSVGTIGIALPLAFPLLEGSSLPAAGVIMAIAICSLIVDVSPFSTNGALVLANARVDNRAAFQNRMLGYTGVVCVLAPVLLWLGLVVLPG